MQMCLLLSLYRFRSFKEIYMQFFLILIKLSEIFKNVLNNAYNLFFLLKTSSWFRFALTKINAVHDFLKIYNFKPMNIKFVQRKICFKIVFNKIF